MDAWTTAFGEQRPGLGDEDRLEAPSGDGALELSVGVNDEAAAERQRSRSVNVDQDRDGPPRIVSHALARHASGFWAA